MKKLFPVLILLVFTLPVYIHNLSPSVYGGDVGDLVTAAVVKGVAHPSGYPLFTLLGSLFLLLPFDATPAWKVGLVSVCAASAGVVVMYFLLHSLLDKKILAMLGALTMGFSYLYWFYAELAEVFSLTALFILLMLFIAVRYVKTKKQKYILFLSFVFGLAVAHHEVLVLIIPTLLILVLSVNWRIILNWRLLIACIFLTLFGFLPYLYVLFAASANPPLNWSDARTLPNVLRLILRQDYTWHPSELGNLYTRYLGVQIYFSDLWIKLSPTVFLTMLVGMISMLFTSRKILFVALFVGFILTGPFYVVYGFTPPLTPFVHGVLERFYFLSTLFLLIFFPFGVLAIAQLISILLKKKSLASIMLLPFFFVPLAFFIYNFPKTDLHDVWSGDYVGIDILSPLPEKSSIYLVGDTAFFNTLYIRYARNIRSDINLIRLPPVAYDTNYLQVEEQIKKENDGIHKYDSSFLALLEIAKGHDLFSYTPITFVDKTYKEFTWMPYGLVYKLVDEDDVNLTKEEFLEQTEHIWDSFLFPKNRGFDDPHMRSLTIAEFPLIYAQSYVAVGDYLILRYGDFETAKEYYDKAIAFEPRVSEGYTGLGLYFLYQEECEKAEENLKRSLSLRTGNEKALIVLYRVYVECFSDETKAKGIADKYYELYKKTIDANLHGE